MTAPTSDDLEQQLRQARLEVRKSHSRRPSKAEKRVNKLDDKITNAEDGPLGTVLQSDAAADVFSMVKEQVRNFAERTDFLIAVLDEVADLHPFVGVAVKIFKAAVTLEKMRRENDEKVVALNLVMCDMMDVLTQLKSLVKADVEKEDPYTGMSIESRLKARMSVIIDSIRQCAKLCDSYQKRHLAIKYLTSFKWKLKFTEVGRQLIDHKADLQFDLQLHTSSGVASANNTLSSVAGNITQMKGDIAKMMDVVFTRMQSPEERELSSFITTRLGGVDAVLKDDALLTQLLDKQKSITIGDAKTDNVGMERSTTQGRVLTVAELRREIGQDVDQVVAQNRFFEQKLDATLAQIKDIKTSVESNADRVIKAYQDGPHDQINDPVMRHIWKYHGWKGNVKATRLVMALRDHFSEGSHSAQAFTQVRASAQQDNSGPPTIVVEEVTDNAVGADREPGAEQWAMQFITVLRVQPLIEAFDDDVSSFVTIAEVNAFTAACPPQWSLLHWIAYWTYGFEMSIQWYFRRIRKVISDICAGSRATLPANRRIVNEFLDSFEMQFVEDLLSGLRNIEQWDYTDWDSDVTFLKFKGYILKNELRMEKTLRRLKYCIDDTNTLALVAGAGRPEKFLLPVIYILLKRTLSIVARSEDVTLHSAELHVVQSSLSIVRRAVVDRICTLQAVYKLRNLNHKEQLERFFCGLYAYAMTPPCINTYWMRSPDHDAYILQQSAHDHSGGSEGSVALFYGDQPDIPHIAINPALGPSCDEDQVPILQSLVGHWNGSEAGADQCTEFTIYAHNCDGTVSGAGLDEIGPFAIHGLFQDNFLTFVVEHLLPNDSKVTKQYEGFLNKDACALIGAWTWMASSNGSEDHSVFLMTAPDAMEEYFYTPVSEFEHISLDALLELEAKNGSPGDDDAPSAPATDSAESQHRYITFTRRMAEHPSAEALKKNRWKALWGIALNSALRYTRGRKFDWSTLYYRSPQRQRYIELLRENRWKSDPVLATEWVALIQTVHEEVLRLWFEFAVPYLLPDSMYRREVVHGSITCDGCRATPVAPTRFLCIVCSADEVDHGIDLCLECFSSDVRFTSQGKEHTPVHSFMQLRTVCPRSYRHSMIEEAKSGLSWAEFHLRYMVEAGASPSRSCDSTLGPAPGVTILSCIECRVPVTTRPYWCCIDCDNFTIVCYACNGRVEKEKPWLYQRDSDAAPRDGHDWSHTLVSAPDPERVSHPRESAEPTTKERFTRLEEKVDKNAADMNDRLSTMERLLAQLVDTMQTVAAKAKEDSEEGL